MEKHLKTRHNITVLIPVSSWHSKVSRKTLKSQTDFFSTRTITFHNMFLATPFSRISSLDFGMGEIAMGLYFGVALRGSSCQ